MLDYLSHLRADSARFAEVLADADPAARVPACPDWTVDDLLWHLGEVQWFWGTIVRDRVQDPEPLRDAERPDGRAALLEFFGVHSAALLDALEATPDDAEVWTWYPPDHSAGFVRRRQAHEAVIHRADAELTVGAVPHLDAELASDGAAEVLEWMYSEAPPWAEVAVDGPVGRVRALDTGASWLVQVGRWNGTSPRTGTSYTDAPMVRPVADGEPSFEVSGAAADLDLWLWNRPTSGEVLRTGDVAAFEAVIRDGVQ